MWKSKFTHPEVRNAMMFELMFASQEYKGIPYEEIRQIAELRLKHRCMIETIQLLASLKPLC